MGFRRSDETKTKGRTRKGQRPRRKKSGYKTDCRAPRARFPRAGSIRRLRKRQPAAQKARGPTKTARYARRMSLGFRSSHYASDASLAILSAKASFAKA